MLDVSQIHIESAEDKGEFWACVTMNVEVGVR